MKISEKIKLLRKTKNLTQSEFANSIGISRGNLANIETGKVIPTQLMINCISLTYKVNKDWLLDESNEDLSYLNPKQNLVQKIVENYEKLDNEHKKFLEHQIMQLIDLQNSKKV